METRLTTQRLVLRPLQPQDAPLIQVYAGDREVAATTLTVPHPYPDGAAEEFIAYAQEAAASGKDYIFAIARAVDGAFLGVISIGSRGEIGYWIGCPHWGKGYGTEAAAAVVGFGFEQMGLHKVWARHFSSNPASGKIMQKVGMICEGTLRQHILKWGEPQDLVHYGILRSEYDAKTQP